MKRSVAATFVLALLTLAAGIAAAAGVSVLVWPGDMDGWAFVNDLTGGPGTGELVAGPASPPLGQGSARLAVDGTGRQIMVLPAYQGTRLDQVTRLEYSAYRSAGTAALAISLQLNVDSDVTDGNNGWQGRLVFEPYYMGAVATGVWQRWDAKAGRWWATGLPMRTRCPQNAPCTWSQLLATFPNAGIHPTLGAVLFKAGGPWTGGFDGNVDAFTIGIAGADTTYDFELQPPDATPPEITPAVSGPLGQNGWYTGEVSVSWTVADPESGLASSSGCGPGTLTAETGGTVLTCSATNGAGLSRSVSVEIRIDWTAPAMAGLPQEGCALWPPNGRLVRVATVAASDSLSGLAPGSPQVAVGSSEPADALGDGSTRPDYAVGDGPGGVEVLLRAERSGRGDGRVYTITARGTDMAGNTATVRAQCEVPHDLGR